MKTFMIFDNGCSTPDRYTIVNQETGDVFGCSENPESSNNDRRFIGNCAAHRIVLYGTGWRQKLPTNKIMKEEIENYINNARLDPYWIGREVNLGILPAGVRRWVAQLKDDDLQVLNDDYVASGKYR
jgi:hypothetical protein